MVSMKRTFFFYDLETSGLSAREDRIMQFAGQRTDEKLNPIGESVNLLVRMTEDVLPSPFAIQVTKITPQMTLMDGVNEAEFCRLVTEEMFTPGTVALGYNTVRFDDEFMRATLWRNFFDPYEWEWKEGRSRWDLLDVVRLTRALRPEGINWPVTAEGKPTNRLELLTKCNGLEHEHAHDALSDVYATIAVAKMIREKQPRLFEFLFKMRDKREVQRLINLANPPPFVYASGRYAAEFEKTTVAVPIAPGRSGNILVWDLRYDGAAGEELLKGKHPVVKELCYNKCPAVAPISVLREEDWARIGLSPEKVAENWERIKRSEGLLEQIRIELEKRSEFPPAIEPEQAIYDGFLSNTDKIKVAAVRNADANRLADFYPDFQDVRLPELLLHYKGRNFPESLDEKEMEKWEDYRKKRLERQVPKFLEELMKIQDEFLREELRLYYENLFASDY